MKRKSLFEKMKERKISYIEEIIKIRDIVTESDKKYIFNDMYKESKLNYLGANLSDAYALLIGIEYFNNSKINNPISYLDDNDITLDQFLDIIEFTKNVLLRKNISGLNSQLNSLIENINLVMGYTFKLNSDDDYIIILKNPSAEAVALLVDVKISDKIYSYLSLRKGDISRKREVLKTLSDDIELIRNKNRDDKFIDKVGRVMQCVRHPKEDKIRTDEYFFINEEESMDELFNMFICVLGIVSAKRTIKKWNI